MKSAWREECHAYIIKNPGKVVTRYQFSQLFGRAWMRAMIPNNIVAGFRVTGVFPVDRFKILPKSPQIKAPSICERTGLKFIPLFTPIRRHSMRSHLFSPSLTPIDDELSSNEEETHMELFIDGYDEEEQLPELFSDQEIDLYTKQMEEGYDITTDERYNIWLSQL